MSRIRSLVAPLTVLALLALPSVALAGGKSSSASKSSSSTSSTSSGKVTTTIVKTGVPSFDEVFSQVGEIEIKLKSAEQVRKKGRNAVAQAVGLAKGTTLDVALAELKTRAEGKIQVALEGTVPKLSVSDAVPDDIQAAIDLVNEAVANYTTTVESLAEVPTQVQALIEETKGFPKALRKDLSNVNWYDIDGLMDRWKQVKKIKKNIEVTADLPDRAEEVVTGLSGDIQTVTATFQKSKKKGNKSTSSSGKTTSTKKK